jgi:hypothetical protein
MTQKHKETFNKLDRYVDLGEEIKGEIMDRVNFIITNSPKTNSLITNLTETHGCIQYSILSDLEILKQTALWVDRRNIVNTIKQILTDIDIKIEKL